MDRRAPLYVSAVLAAGRGGGYGITAGKFSKVLMMPGFVCASLRCSYALASWSCPSSYPSLFMLVQHLREVTLRAA